MSTAFFQAHNPQLWRLTLSCILALLTYFSLEAEISSLLSVCLGALSLEVSSLLLFIVVVYLLLLQMVPEESLSYIAACNGTHPCPSAMDLLASVGY